MTNLHKSRGVIATSIAVALWIFVWLWITRYHFLDDAFIHLRFADLFWRHGFLTYDGVHLVYGDSSPLYIVILALVRAVTASPMGAKAVSVFFYLVLLGFTACLAAKTSDRPRVLSLLVLTAFISPMGIRWLTDGMETSLWVLMSGVMAFLTFRAPLPTATQRLRYGLLFSFTFFAQLFRFEFIVLSAFSTLAIAVRRRRFRLGDTHFLAGSLAALALIYHWMGAFYPDTAIAKSFFDYDFKSAFLLVFLLPLGAALTLGLGLFLSWVGSWVLALNERERDRGFLSLLVVNAVPVFVLLLIAARGQAVQGVRCLLWVFVFSIVWNILFLQSRKTRERPGGLSRIGIFPRIRRVRTVLVCLFIVLLLFESWAVYGLSVDRAKAYHDMRAQRLERLEGQPGVAYDIGFISYFSRCDLCDMTGLVGGRDFAKKSWSQRAEICAARRPVFAFVNEHHRAFLSDFMELSEWVTCYEYNFSNVERQKPHYLIVSPEWAQDICPERV